MNARHKHIAAVQRSSGSESIRDRSMNGLDCCAQTTDAYSRLYSGRTYAAISSFKDDPLEALTAIGWMDQGRRWAPGGLSRLIKHRKNVPLTNGWEWMTFRFHHNHKRPLPTNYSQSSNYYPPPLRHTRVTWQITTLDCEPAFFLEKNIPVVFTFAFVFNYFIANRLDKATRNRKCIWIRGSFDKPLFFFCLEHKCFLFQQAVSTASVKRYIKRDFAFAKSRAADPIKDLKATRCTANHLRQPASVVQHLHTRRDKRPYHPYNPEELQLHWRILGANRYAFWPEISFPPGVSREFSTRAFIFSMRTKGLYFCTAAEINIGTNSSKHVSTPSARRCHHSFRRKPSAHIHRNVHPCPGLRAELLGMLVASTTERYIENYFFYFNFKSSPAFRLPSAAFRYRGEKKKKLRSGRKRSGVRHKSL